MNPSRKRSALIGFIGGWWKNVANVSNECFPYLFYEGRCDMVTTMLQFSWGRKIPGVSLYEDYPTLLRMMTEDLTCRWHVSNSNNMSTNCPQVPTPHLFTKVLPCIPASKQICTRDQKSIVSLHWGPWRGHLEITQLLNLRWLLSWYPLALTLMTVIIMKSFSWYSSLFLIALSLVLRDHKSTVVLN